MDKRLKKAILWNKEGGYDCEVKECPEWMKPYDCMLIIYANLPGEPKIIFHCLPYRTDLGKYHYELIR